jgi:hypothetical protein
MADYFSLLSKAVSNLPKSGAASARQAIYARARAALLRQLRSLGPSLSEADIAREEASLEAAIARLEGQFAAPAPVAPPPPAAPLSRPVEAPTRAPAFAAAAKFDAGKSDAAKPDAGKSEAAAPPRFAPFKPSAPAPAAPEAPHRAAEPYLRAPSPAAPPKPAAPAKPELPARPAAPEAPMRPAAPRPAFAPAGGAALRPTIGAEAPTRPTLGAKPPAAPHYSPPPPPPLHRASEAPPPAFAPPIDAAASDDYDAEGPAPRIDPAAGLDRVAYAPAMVESDSLRPSAPSRVEAPRANPLLWVGLAVVVGIVLSIAVAALVLRQRPQDLAIKETPEASDSQPTAPAAKIAERVGGPATPAPAPAPSPPPSAEPTPAAAAPVASPSPTPTPAASVAANATSTPQPAATPGVPVAARAAMLVAVAADPQKPPAVSLGSVVWSTVPALPGQPATVAVKAEADVPDLKMHAIMTIRKNNDPSLPASHTIDLRVTFADGAEIKGVKDMRVPMMRRDDPPAQDTLSGVRVKISDNYFLVGLNRTDADLAHNVDLLANRAWFDFPLLLSDDRIAKLTFEKGADGQRVIADALAAWK